MRYLIILSCVVFVTASPARNARNEEHTKIETDQLIGDSKVEVSLERTKGGLPKIVVDITEKREENKNKDQEIVEGKAVVEEAKTEEKDDLKVEESRKVEVVKKEEKGESRSTIHVHTPSSPQINLVPNRYPMPSQSRPGYGLEGSNAQIQPQPYDAKKKMKEGKPYNQVNVYVYFPKDMMGMEESQMTVNSYNYDDGTSSSTVVTNSQRLQQNKPEPCPIGFARIKGVCLEVDNRKKRVL